MKILSAIDLTELKLSQYKRKIILDEIKEFIENNKTTIRDIQNLIINICIRKKFWTIKKEVKKE